MTNVFFFTFGLDHKLSGHVQPIISKTLGEAREEMVRLHGRKWAFQYTEAQYLRARQAGTANELLLEPVNLLEREECTH